MKPATCIPSAFFALLLLLSPLTARLFAQTSQGPTPVDTALDPEESDIFHNLHFRNLGPATAGGRITSVVGVPGNPNLYYVGAGGGGVFKTTNGGTTWKPVFEHETTSSIGAVALAPGNPNLVWVGTGEANVRNDVIDGAGIYFSSDAGQSWKLMGLHNAGQISRIIVDPQDPNTVFVGVLGHAWGPNTERGVFRTSDGGKTWTKVLYLDDTTGVADLTTLPGNSKVLFAAMWHFRRYPWTLEDGGPSSGLFRSTDGGDTWKRLSEGLPKGPLGRIAIASAPSNPTHLYSLIASKEKDALLWDSHDMGDHWTKVSDNHALDVRPFYFSRIVISPKDENNVFFLSFNLMQSTDGGKTAHFADHGVHPDHHTMWIDPDNPDRIIQGNDGGVFLSLDGAKSWRFMDGLPVEQFYQIAADSESPYNLCGGLQDNSAWCGPSSNNGRQGITNADWYTVVGGDGEYSVPAPSDPNIVYSDAQNGFIERLDKRNHLSRFVRPVLDSVESTPPSALKYRFNWTSPIAVSPKDANEVYLGGNVVFKSSDGGQSWSAISDDLTRNDKSKQVVAGGPINHDISGAESYDTILALVLSDSDPKVIWVGTDDGLIQLTRDGGKTWTRVDSHIQGAPEWARAYQIGVSPFSPGSAYVSFDAHELGNRGAYVYKTSDFGASWQNISAGLPDAPVLVVREDPNQRGFLFAGTEQGLFFSPDTGAHWNRVKAHFPTAPVWDLKFVKGTRDLIVATHGRGAFIFDDIRPFKQMSSEVQASNFHLFQGGTGTLFYRWESDEGNPVSFSTPNAPKGATVDYLLKAKLEPTADQKTVHQSPVKIVVSGKAGDVIATHYGPSNAGINRFVWDLHYAGVRRLESSVPPESPVPGEAEETRYFTTGPFVLPGEYTVSVTVGGQTEKTAVTVQPDPNLHLDPAIFRAQTEAGLKMRNELLALNQMIERVNSIDRQIAEFKKSATTESEGGDNHFASLLSQAEALNAKMKSVKNGVYDPDIQHNVEEDDIHALASLHAQVENVTEMLASSYGQPINEVVKSKMAQLSSNVNTRLSAFNALLKSDVPAYNKAAESAGASTIFAGLPLTVKK